MNSGDSNYGASQDLSSPYGAGLIGGNYAQSLPAGGPYGASSPASEGDPYNTPTSGPYGLKVLRVADADGAGGGGSSSSPQIPSPFPSAADSGLIDAPKDNKLRQSFSDLTKKKAFGHLKLALVDLTGAGEAAAPYVGYQDNELTFVGSIAKIALILPAFALRQAARAAAAVLVPPPKSEDFFKQLDKAWDGELRRGFRGGKAADSKPNLRAVLAATPVSDRLPLKIGFTLQQDPDLAKAGFRPRLVLALGLSMNEAAALCIRDLGFPFIQEAHRAAGVDGRDGLKLNLDFGGKAWDPSASGGQHATARWIANLLALIARDRVVSKGLADEIRDVMSADFPDLATGIDNVLPDGERSTLTRQGKIGYLDAGPFADCAIIRRKSAKGTMLVYVAVALGGKSHDEIKNVGAALDDCILSAHGEPPKPAPSP